MALYRLAQLAAKRWPTNIALRSQTEALTLTFGELEQRAGATASVLSSSGLEAGQVLISDLQNTSQNLVVQLACSSLGVAYGTAKNDAALAKLTSDLDVGGILCTDAPTDGHVAYGVSLILPAAELQREALEREDETREGWRATGGVNANHAFYNSTSPLTNDAIDELAEDAIRNLKLTPADTACVSITLSHAFGIGSAAAACLSSGACISLPNVDGLHGCGVPSDRAAATLLALEDGATVLYADTHTLKALPADASLPHLRTGVSKISSGADFLEKSLTFAGVDLWALGKRAEAAEQTAEYSRTDALDHGEARKEAAEAMQAAEPAAPGDGARLRGVVKWFNRIKGYGFITPGGGGKDHFVHQTQVHSQGFRSLAQGEEVEYELEADAPGRTNAVSVTGPAGAFVKGAPRERSEDHEAY